MSRIIIRSGQVVSPDQIFTADVLIEGEKIVGITAPNAVTWADAKEIDASGCYVFPGIIDAHTHIQLDTGIYQTDDDWEIGTRAAAYGGVTTVVDFATQFAEQTFQEALNHRLAECKPAFIDYGLHMMVTDLARDAEQASRDLHELRDMGVPSIKLYTTYKPNYYADDVTILHTLRAMPDDMLAMFHCENDDLVAEATARLVAQGDIGWRYHGQARPREAETEAALRVATLSMLADFKPVYIVHCSSAKSAVALEQWREAYAHTDLYFETCIQYLTLDATLYEGQTPEHFILQPPLRNNAYEYLPYFFDGVCVLSTDHCDYRLAKKTSQNDFRVTAGGLPGLETLLPLSFTYFNNFEVSLQRLVEVLCANPAKLFGLYPEKGTLQMGSDADLVIYDPEPEGTIQAENLHYIGGYTPYEGMRFQGRVRETMSRGTILVENGEFVAQDQIGRGRFLQGKPFKPLNQW